MKHPKEIAIADYTYSLPEERIAKYPLAERDASKLLIYKNGEIAEDIYKKIAAIQWRARSARRRVHRYFYG